MELFGARGLWCLLDQDDVIAELSRLPNTEHRTLRRDEPYAAPPRHGAPRNDPAPSRFAAPLNAAIDDHYTALDLERETNAERDRLQNVLCRQC